jgi:hypothetical protein
MRPFFRAMTVDHNAKFPADQFVHSPGVVVFAEHVTQDSKGKEQKYDRQALQAIVDRCNYRIEDTGDYGVLVKGHNPDDPEAEQPPVLGFAGNYRLGVIGKKKPRYAIIADEWHYKDTHEQVRKLPRRSVEIWMHQDMGERFFDPIACLGAETPRLDLGVKFAKDRAGHQVEKYSYVSPVQAKGTPVKYQAVSPGGGNTFVQGTDQNQANYNAEGGNVPTGQQMETGADGQLPPAALQQIVSAFSELDFVKWARGKMQEEMASAGAPEDPIAAAAQAPPGIPGGGALEPDPQLPTTNGGAPHEDMMATPAQPPVPQQQQYSADEDDETKAADYEADEDEDDDTATSPADKTDYEAAENEDQDTEHEDYDCDGDKGRDDYEAEDDEDNEVPMSKETHDTDVVKMSRAQHDSERQKYAKIAKENETLRAEVEKYRKENDDMRESVGVLMQERNDAKREQALTELYSQRSFDLEKALDRCLYARGSKMDAKAFQDHLELLAEVATPNPVGYTLPEGEVTAVHTEQYKRDEEHASRVMKYAERMRVAGTPVSWDAAEAVVAADGDKE